jgi:YD repeat-containing protein
MKTRIPCLLSVTIVLCAFINLGFAQGGKTLTLTGPPKNIAIDGDIKEWGDSLRYYNTQNAINYAIANTKDTLYMAIRVNDRSQQTRILKAGITFSIDPKGKKKEAYSITFPLNVQGSAALPDLKTADVPGDITKQDREELMRERLTTLRGIKVTGFKDIEGEMITTSNTYGFQTAVNYDQNGYLVCEAAIPLSYFHMDDLTKNEWSFNFRINGIARPQGRGEEPEGSAGGDKRGGMNGGGMSGGGRGGRGGRGSKSGNREAFGSAGQQEIFKSEDFWEKFYLAK